MIYSYKELHVYQKAYKLALETYKLTKKFPSEEKFGLCSQLQKAAASIPANIAEGCGRYHSKEYTQFCRIAFGSLNEVQVYFDLAKDLQYITPIDYHNLNKELTIISKMLSSLTRKLEANIN